MFWRVAFGFLATLLLLWFLPFLLEWRYYSLINSLLERVLINNEGVSACRKVAERMGARNDDDGADLASIRSGQFRHWLLLLYMDFYTELHFEQGRLVRFFTKRFDTCV